MIPLSVHRDHIDQLFTVLERAAHRLDGEGIHVAGVDMLLNSADPKASSAIHLVFVDEKVRPNYLEPVPNSPAVRNLAGGVALAPVINLVRMKLTSFWRKDQVHISDMDSVALITPEIEEQLSPELKARLQQIRSTE